MNDRKALMMLIARNMPSVPSVLADKILGSRWRAEHDRQVAERARVEFADELTRKGVHTFDIHSIRRAAKGEQK